MSSKIWGPLCLSVPSSHLSKYATIRARLAFRLLILFVWVLWDMVGIRFYFSRTVRLDAD